MKFVYLRKNINLTVLNMAYKLDLLQPEQEVFFYFTYSRSQTSNAWKIPLEVMKFFVFTSDKRPICTGYRSKLNLYNTLHFVNLHSTYILCTTCDKLRCDTLSCDTKCRDTLCCNHMCCDALCCNTLCCGTMCCDTMCCEILSCENLCCETLFCDTFDVTSCVVHPLLLQPVL
jgi:hypothetical protein